MNIERKAIMEIMEQTDMVERSLDAIQKSAFLNDLEGVLGSDEEERCINTEWEHMRDWMEAYYSMIQCLIEQTTITISDVNKKLNDIELQMLHDEVRSGAGSASK